MEFHAGILMMALIRDGTDSTVFSISSLPQSVSAVVLLNYTGDFLPKQWKIKSLANSPETQ